MTNCPCCSSKTYSICCEPFLLGNKTPTTPEELMRSRYTAYAERNVDYIFKTMKGAAAQDFDLEQAKQSTEHIQWKKLQVISSSQDNEKGLVEFVAHYFFNGKDEFIYEISEFKREGNEWFYTDGMTPKIGRNDICPCKSGKKFKKCCQV